MSSDFYRNTLKKPYRELYDAMYDWLKNNLSAESDERVFDIKGVEADPQEITKTLFSVMNDHPEVVCLGHSKPTYAILPTVWTDEEGHLVVSLHDPFRDVSYAYTTEERERLGREMEVWRRGVISRIRGKTDFERVASLTSIFASDLRYLDSAPSHDVTGVLSGWVVCEGFARAFKYVCDAIGVWCVMAWGTAKTPGSEPRNHCWNIVRIGKQYYHVDSTWANTTSPVNPAGMLRPNAKLFSHGFMFMDDGDMEGNHFWTYDYPRCSDHEAETYRRNGWFLRFKKGFDECLTTADEMKKMVRKVHGRYGDVFVLRCRLVDEDGAIPDPGTAINVVGWISEVVIPRTLNIRGYGVHSHGYSEVSGNYILAFELEDRMEATRHERIEVV